MGKMYRREDTHQGAIQLPLSCGLTGDCCGASGWPDLVDGTAGIAPTQRNAASSLQNLAQASATSHTLVA